MNEYLGYCPMSRSDEHCKTCLGDACQWWLSYTRQQMIETGHCGRCAVPEIAIALGRINWTDEGILRELKPLEDICSTLEDLTADADCLIADDADPDSE